MINRVGIVYLGGASPSTCTRPKLYFVLGCGRREEGARLRAIDTYAFVDFNAYSSSERMPQLCHACLGNNTRRLYRGKIHRSTIKYPRANPRANVEISSRARAAGVERPLLSRSPSVKAMIVSSCYTRRNGVIRSEKKEREV
ncbi:hypothetical protein ALC57_02531 [Trachymyrmex cornetzi]|uniref:Uncharacterized protein n=1 Tax=Trachymyrmex cornetzi TaxID=471704 RepID=A0A195EIL2_9HYME|nr:hypothetical protein ALC57_02531 [Trachymyrmex cornetzi]